MVISSPSRNLNTCVGDQGFMVGFMVMFIIMVSFMVRFRVNIRVNSFTDSVSEFLCCRILK